MSRRVIKWYNAALVTIIGMVGFTQCDDNYNIVMYGVGQADGGRTYTVLGKVSTASGKPINGIKVATEDGHTNKKTVYSDQNGVYRYVGNFYPGRVYDLIFTDIDGEENGGDFKTATRIVVLTEEKYPQRNTTKVVSVTMELKK